MENCTKTKRFLLWNYQVQNHDDTITIVGVSKFKRNAYITNFICKNCGRVKVNHSATFNDLVLKGVDPEFLGNIGWDR